MAQARHFILGIVFALIMVVPGWAQSESDVILTVRNGEAVSEHTLNDLQEMPVIVINTTTIWTDGVQEFTGLPLNELVADLGLTGGTLRARAVNDYAIDIPVVDAMEEGPIVAYFLNGKPMSVREKGPLWIIYPYDSHADFRTDLVYSRSIWQLREIEVVE